MSEGLSQIDISPEEEQLEQEEALLLPSLSEFDGGLDQSEVIAQRLAAAEAQLEAQIGQLREIEDKRDVTRVRLDADGNLVEFFNVSKNIDFKMKNSEGHEYNITENAGEAEKARQALDPLWRAGFMAYQHEGDSTSGTSSVVLKDYEIVGGIRIIEWETRTYKSEGKNSADLELDDVPFLDPTLQHEAPLDMAPIASQEPLEQNRAQFIDETQQGEQTYFDASNLSSPILEGYESSEEKSIKDVVDDVPENDEFSIITENASSITAPQGEAIQAQGQQELQSYDSSRPHEEGSEVIATAPTLPTEKRPEVNIETNEVVITQDEPVIQLPTEQAYSNILPAVEDAYASAEPPTKAPDYIFEEGVVPEESEVRTKSEVINVTVIPEKSIEQLMVASDLNQEQIIREQLPENTAIQKDISREQVVVDHTPERTEIVRPEAAKTPDSLSSNIEQVFEATSDSEVVPRASVEESIPAQLGAVAVEIGLERTVIVEEAPQHLEATSLSEAVVLNREAPRAFTVAEVSKLPIVETPTVIDVRRMMTAPVTERSLESLPLLEFFADQPALVEQVKALTAPQSEPRAVVLAGERAPDGRILDATVLRAEAGELTYEFRASPAVGEQLSERAERKAFDTYAWVAPEAEISVAPSHEVEIILGTVAEATVETAQSDSERSDVAERPLFNRIDITAAPVTLVETEGNRQWPRFFPATAFADSTDDVPTSQAERPRASAQRALT